MADEEAAPEAETPSFDMESAVADVGSSLFSEKETPDSGETGAEELDDGKQGSGPERPVGSATEKVEEEAPARKPPSSWTKDLHDHYLKAPKELQDYIDLREKQMLDGLGAYKNDAAVGKTFREVVTPYADLIAAQNTTPEKAVGWLLNAHRTLSTAAPAERRELLGRIAKSYGIDLNGQAAVDAPNGAGPVDPAFRALQERLEGLESTIVTRDRAAMEQAKSVVASEVEKFASDTAAHPYFDEVADDITRLLNADRTMTLADAYERAVWMNPVTRAKEIAKQSEATEKKLRENARLDALKARKASEANVRSRDTTRAPTDPLGTMEDTMKSTLAEIKQRVH